MSYVIRCEIICDTCKASIVVRHTCKSTEALNIVRATKGDFEKAGGTQLLRGRYRASAHYCRECQDKPMGKPEGMR
jgi:hypothetical protein